MFSFDDVSVMTAFDSSPIPTISARKNTTKLE